MASAKDDIATLLTFAQNGFFCFFFRFISPKYANLFLRIRQFLDHYLLQVQFLWMCFHQSQNPHIVKFVSSSRNREGLIKYTASLALSQYLHSILGILVNQHALF